MEITLSRKGITIRRGRTYKTTHNTVTNNDGSRTTTFNTRKKAAITGNGLKTFAKIAWNLFVIFIIFIVFLLVMASKPKCNQRTLWYVSRSFIFKIS